MNERLVEVENQELFEAPFRELEIYLVFKGNLLELFLDQLFYAEDLQKHFVGDLLILRDFQGRC